jgi:hypothetical protein
MISSPRKCIWLMVKCEVKAQYIEQLSGFQGRHNVDMYINEFKDLINMSGYTDPIAIVVTFCRGLNVMI